MMAMTTSSSISVKPRRTCDMTDSWAWAGWMGANRMTGNDATSAAPRPRMTSGLGSRARGPGGRDGMS